ncbi:MAG: hypothetical protein ACOH2F_16995 [Cellulomonas sp.]
MSKVTSRIGGVGVNDGRKLSRYRRRHRAAAEGLIEGIQSTQRRWHVILRIQSTQEHVRRTLPPSVAQISPAQDEPLWQVAEIHAESLDRIAGLIIALGYPVVIKQPTEKRAVATSAATRLVDAARTP